ncbi:MAG: ROK family protein, partial [Marivivens sp.]|nr:ROK family protein [Marivivens sp.]
AREASTALGISRNNTQSLPVMLETLYERAKSGNRSARTIFQRAGRYLAVGLSNIINLFDPELIILSGERMRFDYLYAAEVLAETHSLTLNQARPRSKIEIQTWDDLVWARGAAALALSELTNRVFGETKLPA